MVNKLLSSALFSFMALTAYGQEEFTSKLCASAVELTQQQVHYDPSYFKIAYPNGDIPADKGVCTDVIVRAYRKLGIDLQKEVHEDMKSNFKKYPNHWGLKSTDTNIDHRRVPNLMIFFSRHGEQLKISDNFTDYKPGDIVTWDLGHGITHIGIVIHKKSPDDQRYLICSQYWQRSGNSRLPVPI